jgi:hypothetical protein
VSLSRPIPGLVIRYNFLWQAEREEGREDGIKDRPCAIVAVVKANADGNSYVVVLPVTHSIPADTRIAIEIPLTVKKRLGLDSERSWIIPTEWNGCVWPGPDLRRVGEAGDESVAYGMLPPNLFERVRTEFFKLRREDRIKGGTRSS